MKRLSRGAFTLVEVAVATLVAGVLLYGAFTGLGNFTGAVSRGDLTLDQLQELNHGAEQLAQDLRDARQIIYPPPGPQASKMLYFRNFEGQIVVYYYSDAREELRRAVLGLTGLPQEDARPPARHLTAAYFSVTPTGLVSWGLFNKETAVLGSAGRKNQ